MKVLIGITSKNRASILPKAIESALSQSYKDKEVWVFDDCSTDNTFLLKDQYPTVKWIFSEVPRGYVYARNLFMSEAGFCFFCSLDDDSWFINNDSIERAIGLFEYDSNIGVIGFDMLSPSKPAKIYSTRFVTEFNNYIGCGHVTRNEAVRAVGLYTENPGYYGGEEKDLSMRLIDHGFKVLKYNGEYVWHDKTNVARNLSAQHRSGVFNDLVFAYRRTPAIYLVPALLVKIFKHIRFLFKVKGLIKPFLLAVRDFVIWLIKHPTKRSSVSIKGFKRYLALSK